MIYIKITVGNGYAGCENTYYEVFPENTTSRLIDDYAELLCQENAESYSNCATGWGGSFDSEEDEEEYYQDAYYSWEEISEEDFNNEA